MLARLPAWYAIFITLITAPLETLIVLALVPADLLHWSDGTFRCGRGGGNVGSGGWCK